MEEYQRIATENDVVGDEKSWDMRMELLSTLSPGELRPDDKLRALGTWVAGARISSSFAIFTVKLQGSNSRGATEMDMVDVILKKSDGWRSIDDAWNQVSAIKDHSSPVFEILGYPERMRPKHDNDASPTCLHAEQIHVILEDGSKVVLATKLPTAPKPDIITPTGTQIPSTPKNYRGAKDTTRFAKFVQFLLDRFGGYEQLSKKPILDVAGGAGGLAFELSMRHNIPCIIVDTKDLKWTSKQLRYIQFQQDCLDALEQGDVMTYSPLARNLHNRFQFPSQQIVQYKTLLDSTAVLESAAAEETSEPPRSEVQAKLQSLLLDGGVSAIVGLHPDQATDHIVDIGMALNIPWAVVPCCVFPNLFTYRTVRGRPVRRYEDLCDFILEKNSSIQETTLPFRGRNRVFYWTPDESCL